MQTSTAHPVKYDDPRKQRRNHRVKRQFSSPRPPRELVRDLLRAHSGK